MFAFGLLLARAAIVTHFVMKCRRGINNSSILHALVTSLCRYMYAIFYCNAEQQAAAMASAARIEKKRGKIATHILPRTTVSAGATSFQFWGCFDVAYIFCEWCV
jgi:hypothetical protein